VTAVDDQRALLGGGPQSCSGRDDVDVVRRLLHGPLAGAVETAGAAMRRLYDRGWITVTGAEGQWRADITPLGVRAAAETMPGLIGRTAAGDAAVPALCSAGTHVGDEARLAVLREVFEYTDVTALIHEPDVDATGGFDVRMSVGSGAWWLSRDPWDIPVGFDVSSIVSLSSGNRDTVRVVMASFAQRHGPSVVVDLVAWQVASPVAESDRRAGPWILAAPPSLARAMMHLAPGPWPGSDAEFLDWASSGIPPMKLRCGYPNGAPAEGGSMHQVLVVGLEAITPVHSELTDNDDRLGGTRNACRAAAIALTSSGPIDGLPVAAHRDPKGNARTMPVNQMERLQLIRTVLLGARWLQAGWELTEVAPLLDHGPGPDEASPLLQRGLPPERVAAWAGYDLTECVQWAAVPDVPADLAKSLLRAGLDPVAVRHWAGRGVPAANLLPWFALVATDVLPQEEIPAWEALGITPAAYPKLNMPGSPTRLTPGRCRQWLDAGIPANHIKVYEHAKASPSDLAPYGAVLANANDPWDVVSAMGLLTDSEAQVPIGVIADHVGRGHPPYTAVFLDGHRFPMTDSARRRAADPPWAAFERVTPPRISWSSAAAAIRAGQSTKAFFTLPSLLGAPDARLFGTHHSYERITRLLKIRPAGCDGQGRPWHVGVVYPAPYDPLYDVDDLVGVVTQEGHVACLTSSYLRPFVEALASAGIHFVVPVIPDIHPDEDEPDVTVRLLPHRELKELIRLGAPSGVHWEWPAWHSEASR
jgi:hypothetical protein